jgi:hypothetical protein
LHADASGLFLFSMKKLSRIAGNSIILFWIIMLLLLVARNIKIPWKQSLQSEPAEITIESGEEWAGIYFKEKKAGYTRTMRQRTSTGYQFTEQAVMNLAMMGVPQRIATRLSAETDKDFQLRTFDFSLASGIVTFTVSGTVKGKTVYIKTGSGTMVRETSITLPDVPSLESSLKWSMMRAGLNPGQKIAKEIFDPITMSNRTITAEVEAVEDIIVRGTRELCFRVRQTFNGITVYSWLNQKGETVKEESPMGFLMQKEPRAIALRGIDESQQVDIVSATGIKVTTPIAKKHIAYLKIRLKNVSLQGLTLDSNRQKKTGDILEIQLEKLANSDTFSIPFQQQGFKDFLSASPFIQSDDKNIIATARSIIGTETDAQAAAKLLCAWVYNTIEKAPTMSIPRAADVLRLKRGDCNEHAVLYAALCRAAGIPAKTIAGIVYLDGSFYYHAWVEIYLGKWIAVDPTMNQFPADATHIKFVEGELDKQLLLLSIVGKIAVDVLEYS